MSHFCLPPYCTREVPDEYLFCPVHWHMVPRPIQRAVNGAYYAPTLGLGSLALLRAQDHARRAVIKQLEESNA